MHDDATRRRAQQAYRLERERRLERRAVDVTRFAAAMNAAGNPGARSLPESEPRPRRFARLRLDQRPAWEVAERQPEVIFRGGPALVSTEGLCYATTEAGGVWVPPQEYLLLFTETPLHHPENLVRVLVENGVTEVDLSG